MNDMSANPAAELGTQPARASSDISAGKSMYSALTIAIAFGTSGGFSPTTAEKTSLELRRCGGGICGSPHFWPHKRDWASWHACAALLPTALLLTAAGIAAAWTIRAFVVAIARASVQVALVAGIRALRCLLRQTLD